MNPLISFFQMYFLSWQNSSKGNFIMFSGSSLIIWFDYLSLACPKLYADPLADFLFLSLCSFKISLIITMHHSSNHRNHYPITDWYLAYFGNFTLAMTDEARFQIGTIDINTICILIGTIRYDLLVIKTERLSKAHEINYFFLILSGSCSSCSHTWYFPPVC